MALAGGVVMHPALEFLTLIDPSPGATFFIETRTDVPSGSPKPRPDPLFSQYCNLTLADVEQLIPKLTTANAGGAAVYFMVNRCDGPRSKANVTGIRGVHADFDGVSAETLAAVRARLQPTIEVQSSTPDRIHFYWLLKDGEEMSTDLAESINRGLVALGADPAATDFSRQLRLPGFRHMKYRDGGLEV